MTARMAKVAAAWLLAILLAALAGGCATTSPAAPTASEAVLSAQLESLIVVPRPRDDGTYRRAYFGRAWADTDQSGCRQRVICRLWSGYWT